MIKDLTDFEGSIDESFMVKSVEKGISNASKTYLNIVLQDVTGTIEAKKWEVYPKDLEVIIPGTIILVHGSVLKYKGKPQVKINSVEELNQDIIDSSKFIPTAPMSLEEMKKEVMALIDSIQDEDVKNVAKGVLKDHWKEYITYPAAVTVHQAYQGGLIFHSLSVCKIALAMVNLYPSLFHRDYIIAGTLLHDIGKVLELSGPIQTKYTRIGKLESHIQIGAMLINKKCEELNVPQEKADLLTHIILSHHGTPEFGSPVVPKTSDAFLVHLADDSDAKFNVMQNYLDSIQEGEFTVRIPWMDGIELYKPKI